MVKILGFLIISKSKLNTPFNVLDLQKVQLIIDTDASFAVDDVVAICLAHSLANKGIWDKKDQ